jgi:capsular exopolysaccharide synthesis family protein
MHVGVPVLAMVRRMPVVAEHGLDAVFLHTNPGAAEAESFRTLHTALALTEGGIRRLVLSSSEPGDGKTTVSSNLSMVFAQSGKRTLLIDADMRRPGLTSLLNMRGPRGLSSVLRDSAPLEESLQANLHSAVVPNLDVLPAGSRPRNPAELLTSDRFSELISWAEENYDQVLIDSPPALVSDAAIIGRLTDGVLLVVRPEKNRRRTVLRAAEAFATLGTRLLGIVVNRLVDENREDYSGYGYGYGYGYRYADDDHDGEPALAASGGGPAFAGSTEPAAEPTAPVHVPQGVPTRRRVA